MGLFDKIRDWFWEPMNSEMRDRLDMIETNRDYRRGKQPKTIKVKFGKADDNITLNLVGLAVSRSVSLLFGKGVEFDLPGEKTPAQEWIDEMYSVNRKEILLHKLAVNGAEAGTAYLKILPDWYERDGARYPRLVNILPETVTINTDPEDIEIVTGYVIEYTAKDTKGDEMMRKQEILREVLPEGSITWTVTDYEKSDATHWQWQVIDEQEWPYEFPPMIHTQNLPSADSVYGEPDITEDIQRLQDRVNYIASNISKIIRYHAHPKTVGIGFAENQMNAFDIGPDKMVTIPTVGADVKNLEMQSDLSSSQDYLALLRNILMDITRTVDVSSLPDKLGALTNFGLRVLYQDALQKLATKRELYGEMLTELNRRCLELAGKGGEGGKCVWPDPLPVDGVELTQKLQADLDMSIVSRQTVAKERGYDWEVEQKRMADEETNESDIGTRLLNDYMKGV